MPPHLVQILPADVQQLPARPGRTFLLKHAVRFEANDSWEVDFRQFIAALLAALKPSPRTARTNRIELPERWRTARRGSRHGGQAMTTTAASFGSHGDAVAPTAVYGAALNFDMPHHRAPSGSAAPHRAAARLQEEPDDEEIERFLQRQDDEL
jgi:hypothetical protein